jgi:hypothetical protein
LDAFAQQLEAGTQAEDGHIYDAMLANHLRASHGDPGGGIRSSSRFSSSASASCCLVLVTLFSTLTSFAARF